MTATECNASVMGRVLITSWPILAMAVFWLFAPPTLAQGFHIADPQGWHFYLEEPPAPEPEPAPRAEPPLPQAQAPTPAAVAPTPAAPAGPPAFSAKWMRENLPKYQDKAWDSGAPADVAAYFYLQRYAMDRSQLFAETAQRVVLADATLDQNARRPIASFASDGVDRAARQSMTETAAAIASHAGVFYFYSSDCGFCAQQNPVLERLVRRINLRVLPIALDGKPMPGSAFQQFVPDNGLAEQLEVSVTPTLFMVRPPNTYVPLGSGVLTDEEIMRRMVDGAHAANWITDEAYARTRAAPPPLLVGGPDAELIDLEDPLALIAALKARLREGPAETPLGTLATLFANGLPAHAEPSSSSGALMQGNASSALQQMLLH